MSKINIVVDLAYRDMIAQSILAMAQDHKSVCCGECNVALFHFRDIVRQLLERDLTQEEELILL